jgi:predicted ATPase
MEAFAAEHYVLAVKLQKEKIASFGVPRTSLTSPQIEHLDEEPAPSPPIINSYGYQSLHEQSHGESFFAVMMHRFGRHGSTCSTSQRLRRDPSDSSR